MHTYELVSSENFKEFSGSTVLMAACYWPSSHCIPDQTFVPVLVELITSVHRVCWTSTKECVVTTPLHILYELDRPGVSKLGLAG